MKEQFLCVFKLCNNIGLKIMLFNYLILPCSIIVTVKYDFCIANIRIKNNKKNRFDLI